MDIHFFAKSDVGRVRSGNEDSFLNEKINDSEYMFCVADGMGGHLAGDVASRLACEKFLETFRNCRKKKVEIPESLELSIRKANQAILKKAEADPMKRGMGTTFSAIVIQNKIAHVIHIGDSRIYMIRENRIRRLTTDHTFVEKLVENGRISAEEAREHPQKNVLYMSLGARDGFFPEIIKDIPVQDGDAIVLCSDGLSNMVEDELIKDTVLSLLPQDAVEELVRLANANGGNDNITLQVVRVGSIESLEKTKPVKIASIRKSRVTFLAIVGFIFILALFWILFRQFGTTSTPMEREPAVQSFDETRPPPRSTNLELKEVGSEPLRKIPKSADSFIFLTNQKLLVKGERSQILFNIENSSSTTYYLGKNEIFFPSVKGDLFFFKKQNHSRLSYTLFREGENNKPLLEFQHTGENIIPLFLSDNYFIFTDLQQILVMKDLSAKSGKNKPYFPIHEIQLGENDQIYFKRIDKEYFLTVYQPEAKSVKIFNVEHNFSRVFELEHLNIDLPLAVEYFADGSVAFYFPEYSLRFYQNSSVGIRRPFHFPNYQAHITRILIDIETGQKVMVADDFRLYLLS